MHDIKIPVPGVRPWPTLSVPDTITAAAFDKMMKLLADMKDGIVAPEATSGGDELGRLLGLSDD